MNVIISVLVAAFAALLGWAGAIIVRDMSAVARLRRRLITGEIGLAGMAIITEIGFQPRSERTAWEGVAGSRKLILDELRSELDLPDTLEWFPGWDKGVYCLSYTNRPTDGAHKRYVDEYLSNVGVEEQGRFIVVIWRDGTFDGHHFQWRIDIYDHNKCLVYTEYRGALMLPYMDDSHIYDDGTVVEGKPEGTGYWGHPLKWCLVRAMETQKEGAGTIVVA